MRLFWCVLGVAVLAACDDDNDNLLAPDTVLDEVPAALSNQSRVRIVFHANGDANNFYCQLDDGDLIACVPPFEADVADGPHVFRVAAALNKATDTTPAEHAWTTDATPPDTAIALAPPALDNSLTPSFEFTGTDPGDGAVTFECALDGEAFAACTSPTSLVVVDGAHTFAVRAKDAAGNVDGSPAEHAWTIDATAPDTVITAGPADGETTGRAASFAFSSPDAAATFECKLDDAAFAPCTTPRAFVALAGGSHTFTVRAKDALAVDPSPATRTWTVDATPPDVAITATPTNPSNDTTPQFAFASMDATATFECQIDGVVTFVACSSPWTGPTVPEGARTFRIRATDPYGNVSPVVTHAWVVDLTPPETTLTAVEPNPTADTTGDFAFASATAGARFECALDAGPFAACTSPLSTTALADGTHTFAVRAVDPAGNTDPTPASHTWRVDATPPDTMITVAEPSPTNDTTGDFAFVATETATFQCSIDGGAFAACASPFVTPVLAQGAHTLGVRAIDGVGNVDPSPATHTWTIDTTAPDTTIVTAPTSPTSDATGTFTFTSNDATATFQCSLDSAAFAPCSTPFTTATLADGAHTLRVRAIDPAGNVDATPDSHTWTIDTLAPATTLTAVEPDPTADPTGDFAFTANQTGATFECSVDGAAFTACTSPLATAPLATGTHTFAVRAKDPAGNTDPTPASHTWRVDVTPPQTTITSAPANPTNDATANFTFTSDEAGTFECSLDGGAFAACTTPLATAALGDGPHTFAVRARDTVGNIDATPASHSWTVDTTPPDTTITTAPPALTNSTQATFAFAANPATGATFECSLDNAAFTACTSPTTITVGQGAHTFRVRAKDALGNTDLTPASHAWTVDTTPPTVTITDAPPAIWPVPYYDFAFSANEPASFSCLLNGSAASCGSVAGFPDNVASTYVVRATDAAGNVGQASVTWTTQRGLVLHYPYEQGDTANTSLLAQRAAYSPDGTTPTQPAIGGWAGTALGRAITANTYKNTVRPLSSGTAHTASMWVRFGSSASGTLFSTVAANGGGLRLTVGNRALVLEVFRQGTAVSTQMFPAQNRWVSVALRSFGSDVDLFIDGMRVATVTQPGAGFDATQAQDMTVGPFTNLDLDDLRFHNVAFTDSLMCTTIARGSLPVGGGCVPLAPGAELDLEGTITNTGNGSMTAFGPFGTFAYITTMLGRGVRIDSFLQGFGLSNLKAYAGSVRTGRSFTFSFDAGGADGTLVDTTTECGVAAQRTCGIAVTHSGASLTFFAQTQAASQTVTVALPSTTGFTSVAVTEQRNGQGLTETLSCYVRGKLVAVLDLNATGDIYGQSGDAIVLPQKPGMTIDDFEFWPFDLSSTDEMLCENAFDGELDHLSGVCALTSN